ncbi:MAG: hypothetical protein GY706_04550, partial [Bacteroides sp.]|nr:hypothetical protein [Bacteroides sp.]
MAQFERLALIYTTYNNGHRNPLSYPDYCDIRDQNTVFEDMVAIHNVGVSFSYPGQEPIWIEGMKVSTSYGRVIDVPPLLGRWFAPEHEYDNVVVLSYEFWQHRLNGDPNIVGKNVIINREPHRVLGITGPDFKFQPFTYFSTPELWVPHDRDINDGTRGSQSLYSVARLKAGVSVEQAQ